MRMIWSDGREMSVDDLELGSGPFIIYRMSGEPDDAWHEELADMSCAGSRIVPDDGEPYIYLDSDRQKVPAWRIASIRLDETGFEAIVLDGGSILGLYRDRAHYITDRRRVEDRSRR